MNTAEAKAYRERWREIEEIERQEAQAATLQERWRQLNALKGPAARLRITRKEDEGELETFFRWATLENKYAPA